MLLITISEVQNLQQMVTNFTNAEGMSLWQESNEIWLLKEIFQSFENSKVKLSTITCSLMLLIANSEVQNLHQKLKNFTNMLKACHSGK